MKNILLGKTWSKWLVELFNISFTQMFTCFSYARQNVAEKWKLLRENCPIIVGTDPHWKTSKLHILRYSIHKYSHVIIIIHRSIGLYKNYTKGFYGIILNTSKLHCLLFYNCPPFYFIAWTNPSVGECGSIFEYNIQYSNIPKLPFLQ